MYTIVDIPCLPNVFIVEAAKLAALPAAKLSYGCTKKGDPVIEP